MSFEKITEIQRPMNKFKRDVLTEQEYFMREAKRLQGVPCPNCADIGCLFRGGVYIGCTACLNYFVVDDDGRLISS